MLSLPLALAAGVILANGSNVRLQVHHPGKPIKVEIVGLNAAGEEVEVKSFPQTMLIGRNRNRTAFVQLSSEIKTLCAATNTVRSLPSSDGSQVTAQFRVRSCTQRLHPRTRTSINGMGQGTLGSRLRQALTAPAPVQIVVP